MGLLLASLVLLLIFAALFAGLLPIVMPLGFAAGGVLETGQAEPMRWWLGVLLAVGVYLLLSARLRRDIQFWWLAILISGLLSAIFLSCHLASAGQKQMGAARQGKWVSVGIVTALPLFWWEGGDVSGQLGAPGSAMPLSKALRHKLVPVDHIDARVLNNVDALMLAQPRLLQPEELLALDHWLRNGGKALILADPLLLWPSALPLGDARRPPVTSLLDPLLGHWGLRLEPANADADGVERRMLASGHVLLLAGASRFALVAQKGKMASCRLEEEGLFALCQIGDGTVRLIADADLIDDRLWLAHTGMADRREAWASDVITLLNGWLRDPVGRDIARAPQRVVSEAGLFNAMRWAMIMGMAWVGLGWLGHKRFSAWCPSNFRA